MTDLQAEVLAVMRALPNYSRLSSMTLTVEGENITLDAMFSDDHQ